MKSYWGIVNNVIKKADVLLLLLDARQVAETVNQEIISRAKLERKRLIFAITKADLVDVATLEQYKGKFKPMVIVSGKTGYGIPALLQEIFTQAKKNSQGEELIKVGVLGYPNVGKSSLINVIRKKEVARISGMSGYTKFTQRVRVHNRILIIDTPGVLPDQAGNFMRKALIGSLDYTHIKEPIEVAIRLLEKYPGKLEKFYALPVDKDLEVTLDAIGAKLGLFKRGGVPDRIRTSRTILCDWHQGKIGV